MLRPGDLPTQMDRWYDRLAPIIEDARARLSQLTPARVAGCSGCTQDADGRLALTFLWDDYAIDPSGWTVHPAAAGDQPTEFTQALILTYLVTADGTAPSGRWISYHDLPGGMFYAQAFRGYAENRLVRELGADGLAALRASAAHLGGQSIDVGNAGFAYAVLPRIHLAAVYWLGDEDFPSRASILFEDTAPHYMSTDGLAVLGSHLVNALLRCGREGGLK